MEELKNSPFELLSFPADSEVYLKEKTLYVKKWNWEFETCLDFQKAAQKIIQSNRDFKVYIFCNHPHCFTLGRGNERGQADLVAFDEKVIPIQ